MATYEETARDLRLRIDNGEWSPGERMPTVRSLAAVYQVNYTTVRSALAQLAAWGYVSVQPRVGTKVVDRTVRRTVLKLGQSIGYDPAYGYIYNPAAGDWAPIAPPTRSRVEVDLDVADLLDIAPGTSTLARHRVVGPGGRPEQTTTTYFAPSVADDYDVDDTGPGGWMQHIEQVRGLGPLSWRCSVASRLSTTTESADLRLSRGAPVLVLAFTVRTRLSVRPVAVDVMVFDSTRYRVEFPATRSREARWPVTPATRRNTP